MSVHGKGLWVPRAAFQRGDLNTKRALVAHELSGGIGGQ